MMYKINVALVLKWVGAILVAWLLFEIYSKFLLKPQNVIDNTIVIDEEKESLRASKDDIRLINEELWRLRNEINETRSNLEELMNYESNYYEKKANINNADNNPIDGLDYMRKSYRTGGISTSDN